MNTRLKFLGLLLSFVSLNLFGQSYVGGIDYQGSYQYIKIACTDGNCKFSMPYMDGDKKFDVTGNIQTNSTWSFNRDFEKWEARSSFNEKGVMEGIIKFPTGQQPFLLREQKKALSQQEMAQYIGFFNDSQHRKVLVYERFNYLHLISPYSEEVMSLKPIGNNSFWSVSGEESRFSNPVSGKFQDLLIKDRFGNETKLRRIPDPIIQEKYVTIGNDSIYTKMYIPTATGQGKTPACLILPGGGATGMENYEFEARFFAANGIASLLFDKSGNGKSKGPINFQFQSFEDKNKQYMALFQYLKSHAKTDPQKIGVHGPSEGGRLSLMMAIDLGNEVAFVNAVAAPLMTMREGQFYAMSNHHRDLGVTEKQNTEIQLIWDDYYNGIIKGEISSETIDKANGYREINQRMFLPPNNTQLPAAPHKDDLNNDRVVKEAGKITCPMFLQYGENDTRVNGVKSLQNFYPKITNPAMIHTRVYKRGEHSLMTPEYKICPGYLNDKIVWLKSIGILE